MSDGVPKKNLVSWAHCRYYRRSLRRRTASDVAALLRVNSQNKVVTLCLHKVALLLRRDLFLGAGLITFPPSLDSELARFLMKHYGIDYEEKPHAFIFAFLVTLWHAGTAVFPLLYSHSFKLIGPKPMADYFDPRSAPNLRLLPQDAAEKRQVDSDWTLFNETLAFATARFA